MTREEIKSKVIDWLYKHRAFHQEEVTPEDYAHFVEILTDIAEMGYNTAIEDTITWLDNTINYGTIVSPCVWYRKELFINKYKKEMQK